MRPEPCPAQLTDLDQELELLAGTGVDHVVVLTFDEARSKEPAEDFVHEVLVGCLNAKLVIVGDDFHFGHERRGNVALLAAMGADLGFEVEGLDLVGVDGAPAEGPDRVSSTAIRRALAAGDLAAANEMLGRQHEVRGIVEHGDHRAASGASRPPTSPCPSASSCPPTASTPAGTSGPTARSHPGAASLGRRPDVLRDQPYRLLEVHLLDVDDAISTASRPGPVRPRGCAARSGSTPSTTLVAQIGRDCDDARRRSRAAT